MLICYLNANGDFIWLPIQESNLFKIFAIYVFVRGLFVSLFFFLFCFVVWNLK